MEFLDQLVENLSDWVGAIPNIVPIIIGLVLGVALIGWGYSLFRVWLSLFGLYSGYRLGVWLAERLELAEQPYWIVVILITLAIALLFALALKISIFIAGFFLAMYLVNHLGITLFGLDSRLLTLIGGIILGILAAVFVKVFIVLGTAISGAYLVTDAIYAILGSTDAGTWINQVAPARSFLPIMMQILLVILVVLGCVSQYKLSDRGRRLKLHGRTLHR